MLRKRDKPDGPTTAATDANLRSFLAPAGAAEHYRYALYTFPMTTINPTRRAALEAQLGHPLPATLLRLLAQQPPIVEGNVALLTPERVWDVRTSYTLDDTDTNHPLDSLYRLVGDVLPPDTLPVAADWADNFYCLVLAGPDAGRVVYWDHERDPGDHRTQPVAASLDQFFTHLVADPSSADT